MNSKKHKKLAPLRKQKSSIENKNNKNENKNNEKKRLAEKSNPETKSRENVNKKSKLNGINKKTNNNDDDDDDNEEEWEKIEKMANYNNDGDDDDHNDDDDDVDDEDDIPLENESKKLTEEQYTFDFKDIEDKHVESITTILKSSFFSNPTVSYQIAQEILKSSIGTAISCESDDEVFAFASVITMDQLKTSNSPFNKVLDEIIDSISKLSSLTNVFKTFQNNLQTNSSEIGILLHSRFTNLPIQLISPLHKNLIDDITWAKKNGSKTEKGLKKVLLLSASNISESDRLLKNKKPENIIDVTGSSSVLHEYFENDIFCQHSVGVLQFKSSLVQNKNLCAALIEIDKLDKCLKQISSMIDL